MSMKTSSSDNVSIDLPEMQPSQLAIFTEIGKGRFKTVSTGCHTRHGKVAVLEYKKESSRNEVSVLANLLQHGTTHIPEVFGYRKDNKSAILAQELSSFGSLKAALQDPDLIHFWTPAHKLHVAEQLAQAVAFLGCARVVHADLACRNLLVFHLEESAEKTKVKLTDFMNAIVLPASTDHVVKKLPQATRWCAPETVASNKWGLKTDVWSLGATVWELFSNGSVPWTNYSKRSEVAKVLRDLAQSGTDASALLGNEFSMVEPCSCPPAASAALMSCMQVDARARPTARHVAASLGALLVPVAAADKHVAASQGVLQQPAATPEALTMEPPSTDVPRHSPCRMPGLAPAVLQPSVLLSEQLLSQAKDTNIDVSKPKTVSRVFTPPTRCPSTPECASVSSCPECVPPRMLNFLGGPYSNDVKDSTDNVSVQRRSSSASLSSSQQDALEGIQMLCCSPNIPQSKEDLKSIRELLSSPEALCGLGVEKQLYLRSKLAAKESNGIRSLPVRRLVYQDTIVPLVQLETSFCNF